MKLFRSRRRDEKLPLLVFREFEAGVNLIEDYDQIARNFLGKIKEVCPGPKLLLLVHDADSGRFQPAASVDVGEAEGRTAVIPRDSRLAKWLKVNETHLELKRRPGLQEYLTPKEAGLMAALGIEIAFPLISMNRLIGILLVGSKPGGAAVHPPGGLLHPGPPAPGRHRPGERPPLQGAARALPPHVAGRPPGHDRRAGGGRGPRDPQPADGHPLDPPVPRGQVGGGDPRGS